MLDQSKWRRAVLLAGMLSAAVTSQAIAGADAAPQRLYDRDADCSVINTVAPAADAATWDGSCAHGLATGRGTAVFLSNHHALETVTALFQDGTAADGNAEIRWADGRHYTGEIMAGRPDGEGVLLNAAGDRFDGDWTNGVLDGRGSVVWANGDRYDGDWVNGRAEGHGVQLWANGQKYDGTWKNDLPNGPGTFTRKDGTQITATFVGGKPARAGQEANTATAQAAPRRVLDNLSGMTLIGVDGSTVALTQKGDGFVRVMTSPDGAVKTAAFTFLGDGVGTITAAGDPPQVLGVFHVTPAGIELDYADGHSEVLAPHGADGLTIVLRSPAGEFSCQSWYAQNHVFSVEERKAAVAAYARRLGVSDKPVAASADCPVNVPAPAVNRHTPPSPATARRGSAHLPHETADVATPDVSGLQTVPVKQSTVHLIDTEPSAVAADEAAIAPVDERIASNCLKVDSDGSYWGFRNHCSYSVQYAFCLLHGADDIAACSPNGAANLSGSVSPNGFGPLFVEGSLGGNGVERQFRWVGCRGGAGEVVAHLDQVEPPSGRCVGSTRVLARGN